MNPVRTRLHVAADGTISGRAPADLPPGDHDAEIIVSARKPPSAPAELWARIRALQDEVASLPVLDPRAPEEILGYNEAGLFD